MGDSSFLWVFHGVKLGKAQVRWSRQQLVPSSEFLSWPSEENELTMICSTFGGIVQLHMIYTYSSISTTSYICFLSLWGCYKPTIMGMVWGERESWALLKRGCANTHD